MLLQFLLLETHKSSRPLRGTWDATLYLLCDRVGAKLVFCKLLGFCGVDSSCMALEWFKSLDPERRAYLLVLLLLVNLVIQL